jgi:uncharacterized protein (TIGR03435 family)
MRRVVLVAAAWVTFALPVAFGQATRAQSDGVPETNTVVASPVFDVAAIRENPSDPHERSHIISSPDNGNFQAINVPLMMLLRFAFGVPENQIVNGPAWLNSKKFDIEAKSDSSVDNQLKKLGSDQARLEKQQMLQALFADRFALVVHRETRELPIFELVVAKDGPKLLASKANGTTIDRSDRRITALGITTTVFAEQMAKALGRVVEDKTGIEGRYDFALTWMPNGDTGASPGDSSGPSIFTAIQEQLGLKLRTAKGSVEVLVIDRAELPSAN